MGDINDFSKAVEKLYRNTLYDSDKGILKFEGSRVILLFSNAFASIQRRMEKLLGAEVTGMLLYETYKEAGRNAGSFVARVAKTETEKSLEAIPKLSEAMRIRGWGRLEAGERDEYKSVFIVRNSPIAEAYGKSDRAVCHQIRGLFAGYAEFLRGERRECVESRCTAKGDDRCEFVIAKAEDMPKLALERLKR